MNAPFLIWVAGALAPAVIAQVADHHQHLFSSNASARAALTSGAITARDLIRHLDAAGIKKAAVFSVAYTFANPNKAVLESERALVRAENDWTAAQVAEYPERLIGFCSVNPLRDYALGEISRCARNPNLRTGLKLHFGNSDVDLANKDHLSRVRDVFRAANRNRMSIAVHARSTISKNRPYGAKYARILIEQLLPEISDATLQIAHLAGSGGYDDPAVDEALEVYVQAIRSDPERMQNVYFDVSGVTGNGNWKEKADRIVSRIRQLGLSRMLYGSDAPVSGNLPTDVVARWRQLPLTQEEFRTIESNIAPYLRVRGGKP